MRKKLITQMWNERRLNIGLWLELLLVSVVLWFVVDYLYVTVRTYYAPLGYDIAHTYCINVKEIPESSPNYTQGGSGEDGFRERKERFVNYLKSRPEIEAVGSSFRGIHYSGGSEWNHVEAQDGLPEAEGMKYIVTPGYLSVFRMEGFHGESSQEMGTRLKEHTFLAGADLFGSVNAEKFAGMVNRSFGVYGFLEDSVSLQLGGVLKPIRLNEFLPAGFAPAVVRLLPEEQSLWHSEYFIRVKAGHDRDFIFRIKQELEQFLGAQNLMISDLLPVSLLRHNSLRDKMNELRNYSVVMAFLMVNVFLGLLGTFWYRTQQRYSEIALHIVVGSTRRQVLMRFFTEGLLLLLFAMLPALALDFCLAYNGLADRIGSSALEGFRFPVTVGITFVCMAGMILAGIFIPAYRVMKMRPVEALHEE